MLLRRFCMAVLMLMAMAAVVPVTDAAFNPLRPNTLLPLSVRQKLFEASRYTSRALERLLEHPFISTESMAAIHQHLKNAVGEITAAYAVVDVLPEQQSLDSGSDSGSSSSDSDSDDDDSDSDSDDDDFGGDGDDQGEPINPKMDAFLAVRTLADIVRVTQQLAHAEPQMTTVYYYGVLDESAAALQGYTRFITGITNMAAKMRSDRMLFDWARDNVRSHLRTAGKYWRRMASKRHPINRVN